MDITRKDAALRHNEEDSFTVVYEITASTEEEARDIAFSIQVEQTIEFPYEFLEDEWIKEHMVGRLESLEEVAPHVYDAHISYAATIGAHEVTQVLNMIFGNSSLQPHIWVKDIQLCPTLEHLFKGPAYGLAGIRQLVQVPSRPMLQAVIKPVGSTVQQLSHRCAAYVEGGIDVIKDDHGITNQIYAPFKERVKACAQTILEANDKFGRHTLYGANVSADGPETIERAYEAKELGATAIMVAPALVGFGTMHKLRTDPDLQLPIISHPSWAGGFMMDGLSGIKGSQWFGMLNRLCGADMAIFVSYGGRFRFSPETCQEIHRILLSQDLPYKCACPCPGGGITEKRLPELMDIYGPNTMFLVGGDLFRRGPNLAENAKAFIALLESSERNH